MCSPVGSINLPSTPLPLRLREVFRSSPPPFFACVLISSLPHHQPCPTPLSPRPAQPRSPGTESSSKADGSHMAPSLWVSLLLRLEPLMQGPLTTSPSSAILGTSLLPSSASWFCSQGWSENGGSERLRASCGQSITC